jgi:glycosyltransferase involved in cell wall biosynthesis
VTIPWTVRKPVRRARNGVRRAGLLLAQTRRWREIAAAPPPTESLAVSYGYERMPRRDEVVYGGQVKFQLLNEHLPNEPRAFNVLYLGSTSMPLEASLLVRLARRRGAAFVWNQNGVAYPGWHGPGWDLVNAPRAHLMHAADHVLFQSAFCKLGADRYYGERRGPWEVLYNPVETRRFVPAATRQRRPLTLVLAGNQYQRYRLVSALETLAVLRRGGDDARLIVTGSLTFSVDADQEAHQLVQELQLCDAVEFTGAYTQAEAPELYRRGDILLHTKVNDPCPTVVLEAMATGLPVAYPASGGTPELVGADAGIGVPTELDWEHDVPPASAKLAAAVRAIADRLDDYADAARERSKAFDVTRWVARHREVFEELIGQ